MFQTSDDDAVIQGECFRRFQCLQSQPPSLISRPIAAFPLCILQTHTGICCAGIFTSLVAKYVVGKLPAGKSRESAKGRIYRSSSLLPRRSPKVILQIICPILKFHSLFAASSQNAFLTQPSLALCTVHVCSNNKQYRHTRLIDDQERLDRWSRLQSYDRRVRSGCKLTPIHVKLDNLPSPHPSQAMH
jgi:hypothetical protein